MRWILKYFPAFSILLFEAFNAPPLFADMTQFFRQQEAEKEKIFYLIMVAIIQFVIIILSLLGLRKLKRSKDEN